MTGHVSLETGLQRTGLYNLHVELGARFCPFAGFEMPLQYQEGLRSEHLHTRAAAGLFDVSHMGQLRVSGKERHEALERALPIDFDGWHEGVQRYSVLLNDQGGIEDDLMVLRLADSLSIVVNASGRKKDLEMLRSFCPTLSLELLDAGLLALQGPASEEVLRSIQPEASGLRFMEARTFVICGADCLVVRSGYTGEDGFEISVPDHALEEVARKLLSHPAVKMVGLAARDTLRLEAGLPLYGQDLSSTTTINQAGLHWVVAKSRRANGAKQGGFPGAEIFLKESANGTDKRMVGLIGREAVPIRHGAVLRNSANAEIGVVTSGTVSPSTKRCVMLGYVASRYASADQLFADVRGVPRPVSTTKLPFVPKRYKR